MVIESKHFTVRPVDAAAPVATKQAKLNRRRSIFAKLVKRSSVSVEPTFVPANSDHPLSALFSPTRQVHSMDEEYLRNTNSNSSNVDADADADADAEFDDGEFRPPAFLFEQIKREREAKAADQKRRHSICVDSKRLQTQRMLEKMEKIRAFDDLIQSGKTKTIKLTLTPELAV